MWKRRRLTTLWAFTTCYRDIITFLPLLDGIEWSVSRSSRFIAKEIDHSTQSRYGWYLEWNPGRPAGKYTD
jgi:hypothetical protein